MLSGLFDRLREAHSRADVKAIVVTGAKGKFSAGFDINEFVKQAGGGGIDSTCAPTHSQANCLAVLALSCVSGTSASTVCRLTACIRCHTLLQCRLALYRPTGPSSGAWCAW